MKTFQCFTVVLFLHTILYTDSKNAGYSSNLERAIQAQIVHVVPAVSRSFKTNVQLNKSTELIITCYAPGSTKRSLLTLWRTVTFYINSTKEVSLYHGCCEDDIYQQFKGSNHFLNWFLPWKVDSVSVTPFNKTCIGIRYMSDEFGINVVVRAVDPCLLACLLSGLALFLLAERLSKNVVFYYGTGMTFGVLASVLIAMFILSRFIPKKSAAFAVVGFGFSITAWMLQYLWQNVQQLIESYSYYIGGYFVFAGIVSFAVCYYRGPVTNPRLLDLIKWSVQAVGLLLIYLSCQVPEFSWVLIALIVTFSYLPSITPSSYLPSCCLFGPFAVVLRIWRRKFPPKIRLLSEEEYIAQGIEETRKALDELRQYCQSPNCNAWKTISRVSSPVQFAKWVEGSSEHLTDDEMLEHERNPSPRLFFTSGDDEDDDD